MSNKEYSKREVDTLIEKVEDHLTYIRDTVDRVEKQTIKTNNRVDGLEQWKAKATGAITILTVIVVPVALIVIDKLL